MPILNCHDGDLNGYGCISSQFADALADKTAKPPQWFGKITRFLYGLVLPDGTRVEEDVIKVAIVAKQITSCAVTNVTYTRDPIDPAVAYAEGEIVIVAVGGPIASKTYKFKHTLKNVWRVTETKLS